MAKKAPKTNKQQQTKAASVRGTAASYKGVESVPISPSIQERVRKILRERGFKQYQGT
jgi:hypothetical protein